MADEPAPPGAEEFTEDKKTIAKSTSGDVKKEREKRRSPSPKSSRRRSPPVRRDRRSRSKSRNRNYSPPRRYGGGRPPFRRSPDRSRINRSRSRNRFDRRRGVGDRRSRSRDRFRGGRRNSTRSRSVSPRRHWSPSIKKPASPPPPIPPPQPSVSVNVVPINAPNQQYSAPPPPIFNDNYQTYPTQYSGQTFGVPDYAAAPPPPPQFSTSYPPPPAWSMPVPPAEAYVEPPPAVWSAPTTQIQVTPILVPPPEPSVDQLKREAAVAQEVQNQREELKKQRNDYLKKATNMKKELKMLKDQMIELSGSGDAPPSPTTKGYLDENEKLQGQIQKKINTIENVIDMLNGIIGIEKPPPSPISSNVQQKKMKKKASSTSSSSSSSSGDESSPERLKTKIIESMKTKRETSSLKEKIKEETKKQSSPNEKKINYIFYDPEMHWCQTCNVFPKSAKDFLNHLHCKEHLLKMETQNVPWHEFPPNDEFPNQPNAPSKRTPIRGLQFFVPATSWFCKLCKFWMGDLHCASAHLKSKTHWESYNSFYQKNFTFEVEWMAERQKAIDLQQNSVPPPPPQITSVSTSGMEILDGIPLQLKAQKIIEVEKGSKKRKKKSDDKKDKKKKKRSKKRKKGSSSSSSSSSNSSSTSDSEDEKKKLKENDNRSSSIRVAMRNALNSEGKFELPLDAQYSAKIAESRGKWETIQEPLPGSVEAKKKDEIMISQWNTPQPIISESEKKLLEQLKGKLKSKPSEENKKNVGNGNSKIEKKDDSRSKNKSPGKRDTSPYRDRNNRSRSRGKGGVERNRFDRRSRSRGRRSRSLDSRGRFRRSRSRNRRSRSRGRVSPFRRRRRSNSRDRRRRSNSRSRSRSTGRRIEKAIVRYPEFRPRVPDQPEPKKKPIKNNEDDTERKKSPTNKKSSSSNGTSGKKLPFIGRMPVLVKKQQEAGSENSTDKKDDEGIEDIDDNSANMHSGYYTNQSMMMHGGGYPHYDYDDLMPDPMQYVTLMGAPPPPPPPQHYEDEKEILPPGIDETETEFVPKPISDAPIPRKGPLPKDFEEALNIIFPGEKKPEDIQKELELKAAEVQAAIAERKAMQTADLARDGIHMVNLEETQAAALDEASQISANENYMKFSEHSQDVQDMALSDIPAPLPPPLPPQDKNVKVVEKDLVAEKENDKKEHIHEIILEDIEIPSPTDSDKERRQQELDDLAMLGIDADDLAAQCI